MPRLIPILAVLALMALPAAAQDLVHPSPDLTPRRVVEIQLDALQQNDVPIPDAGIAQTWAFANPNNRRATGPLGRFAAMIKGPMYGMLLGHRQHVIELLSRTETEATFAVTVITAEDGLVTFRWVVRKVQAGEFSGSWMTVNVSPPLAVGEPA